MTAWGDLYERFDPRQPARDWRCDRPYSPMVAIRTALERPFGDKRFLLLGSVGTGKTTELLHLAAARVRSDLVVVIDVHEHLHEGLGDPAALQHIQPWEVLFLCGLHVYTAAQRLLGHEWSGERTRALESARAAFGQGPSGAQINLGKLVSATATLAGAAVGGAGQTGLQLLSAAGGATRWELPLGLGRGSTLTDQDERVQKLLQAVNDLITDVRETYQGLTLLIDGLDRIVEVNTIRQLYIESAILARLDCPTVMTGSVVLRREGLALGVRGFHPYVLANVPVLDPAEPTQQGQGIDFFLHVYRRRVEDLPGGEEAIPLEELRRLAYYSGGRAREFMRLVRMTAERAFDRKLTVATRAVVDDALDERRRLAEMGLTRGTIDLLRQVADDPMHALPDDPRIGELLNRWWLLPYPNESEWYYPHPLLTTLLRRA